MLQSLVAAGFTTTVVGRTEKKADELPSGAKSVAVDYSSSASLVAAFTGQDAIVSTLGFDNTLMQKEIIDAAITAGVARFIPSDFGSITTESTASHLQVFRHMVEIQEYLKEKAALGKIDYTVISPGAFTEYIAGMFDWKKPAPPLWEGGHHPVSSTSIGGIGKAIVGVFKNPEQTKNRNIKIHEFVFTQAQILDMTRKVAPAGVELHPVNIENAADQLDKIIKNAEAEPTVSNMYALVGAAVFGGKWKASYDQVDNELVGLAMISNEEVQAKVTKAVA